MATFTKAHLSGAADGLAVKVAATSSTGTTIHTAVSGTTAGSFSEIWIWCCNTGTSDVKVAFEWGTTTAADGNIEMTIPGEVGRHGDLSAVTTRSPIFIIHSSDSARHVESYPHVLFYPSKPS